MLPGKLNQLNQEYKMQTEVTFEQKTVTQDL